MRSPGVSLAVISVAVLTPALIVERTGVQAVGLAERAARLSGPDDPAPLDILAAAYAEAGRFAEAIQTARRAAALATQRNIQPLADDLRARTSLYEAGQTFRETK